MKLFIQLCCVFTFLPVSIMFVYAKSPFIFHSICLLRLHGHFLTLFFDAISKDAKMLYLSKPLSCCC